MDHWPESIGAADSLPPLFPPLSEVRVQTLGGDSYTVSLATFVPGADLNELAAAQHPTLGPPDGFILTAETSDGTPHHLGGGGGGRLLRTGRVNANEVRGAWSCVLTGIDI